jgi:hypothetical protein
MELNRNHYFLVGVILLFLGAEFRQVESFVLTPELTNFLARRTGHPVAAVSAVTRSILQMEKPAFITTSVKPPEWLGWFFLSAGAVLVLHSWAMPKPGG